MHEEQTVWLTPAWELERSWDHRSNHRLQKSLIRDPTSTTHDEGLTAASVSRQIL